MHDAALSETSSQGAVSCFTFGGTGGASVGALQEYPRTIYSFLPVPLVWAR